MQQFTNGFGNISYLGGLLSCAQIRSRKPYLFNPTVLKGNDNLSSDGKKESDEFIEYIQLLKNRKGVRERFLIAEQHWITGDIKIDEEGNASLLLIDSLGKDSDLYPYHIINAFAKAFPKGKIYFANEKRQFAMLGCSIFVIDDILHLFIIEKYLDKKYEKTGLFGYLEDQENLQFRDHEYTKDVKVIVCNLPLTLLRTGQKHTLFTQIFSERSEEEQNLIINKKGETAGASREKDIHDKPSGEGKISKRVERKLVQLAEQNFKFLLLFIGKTENLQEEIQVFSLAGFKARMCSSLPVDVLGAETLKIE